MQGMWTIVSLFTDKFLWYLENIFSLMWRGNFVRSKASTPRLMLKILSRGNFSDAHLPCIWKTPSHQVKNIVKVKRKFVCEKWYNSSHWCTGLASEKFPFYIRLKIFSCVKWLSIFTDKLFYATLASTKLPRCTCLASEKLAKGFTLPCI